jgi:hypothetical protein
MKTQAWGWLAAAVMAAGLNASYHDGGLRWAHEIADQVAHNSNAVIDLATGRADQFLAETRFLKAGEETSSCPLATAFAEAQNRVATRAQSGIAESDAEFARVEVMTDREQAQLVRLEANRARIEARLANVRIPALAFNPVVVPSPRLSICPRLRVNAPHVPAMKVPAVPMVRVDISGAGPV